MIEPNMYVWIVRQVEYSGKKNWPVGATYLEEKEELLNTIRNFARRFLFLFFFSQLDLN